MCMSVSWRATSSGMNHERLAGRPLLRAMALPGEFEGAPQGGEVVAGALLRELRFQFPIELFHGVVLQLPASASASGRAWRGGTGSVAAWVESGMPIPSVYRDGFRSRKDAYANTCRTQANYRDIKKKRHPEGWRSLNLD